MTDTFISYSRRDIDFVRRLYDALQRTGRKAWVDWEGIPASAEWMKEIHAAIEAADTVLVVVSSHSAASSVCAKEIVHAAGNNKRLIPIVCENVDSGRLPPAIAERNWIFFRETDDFDRAFAVLTTALDADLDWIKRHTRLLTRAIEWQSRNRDYAYALHGSDLHQSERDLARGDAKEPRLTSLQIQYILASRRDADRRRNIALGMAGVAATVLIAVGLLFWQKRLESNLNLARDFREKAMTELTSGNPLSAEVYFAHSLAIDDALETRQYLLQARAKSARLVWVDPRPPGSTLLGVSPDGTWFVAQSGTALEVWQLPTRTKLQSLPIAAKAWAVAVSNNGRLLAVGADNAITVWRIGVSPAVPLATITNVAPMTSLAVAPSGDLIVAGGSDGTLMVWDVKTQQGAPSLRLRPHRDKVASLAFTRDGASLASASWDNTTKLWAVSRVGGAVVLEETATLAAHDDAVLSVAYSPDGKIVASGSWDNRIWLWDARTGQRLRQFTGHTGGVVSLAFSADGLLLASGSEDHTARVWNVESGQLQLWLPGPQTNVTAVAFATTAARQLAQADEAGTIRLWDLDAVGQRDELITLRGHERPVNGLMFNPQSDQLVSGSWDRTVRLWDLATRTQQVLTTGNGPGHTDSVTAVRFSPDGTQVASASKDATVRLWDIAGGTSRLLAEGSEAKPAIVRDVAFSPDGRSVASASDDGMVRIWQTADGRLQRQFAMDGDAETAAKVLGVAFSPDGRLLAASNEAGEIKLWRLADATLVRTLAGHQREVWQIAFSRDGALLVSASDDRTARVWDVATGRQVGKPLQHEGAVWTVDFASDNKTFVTGSSDSTAHIWSVARDGDTTVTHRFTLRLSDDPIWAVAFSRKPGSRLLAVAGADRTIRVLDVDRLDTMFDDREKLERQAEDESGLEIAAGPELRVTARPVARRE